MLRPLILATLLSLAACATVTEIAIGEALVWHCDGGRTFRAHNTSGGNAKVVAGGQTYRLPGVMAGSGARYFDGSVEYWEHHGEAMLNGAAGGPYENCRN
ncbi:MAG: MliC family protein [Terricaulis sp.]